MVAERVARGCLWCAFWLPLGVCTTLALTPSPPDALFRFSDVMLHAFAFTYLTFALGVAYDVVRWPRVALWMLGYGILIEVLQSFEVERSAELKDLAVDLVGIAAGIVLREVFGAASRRTVHTILRAVLPPHG